MRNVKLTKQEKEIESALRKGEFVDVAKEEVAEISKAILRRKKDAVLNIRVNSRDLNNIKHRAKKLGIRYQTFISEMIHRLAML
jgi:predicted DNA binding CopG/RHH family protein